MAFYKTLEQYGDRVALKDEKGELTYLELAQLADKAMDKVPSRSLAFLLCKNTRETVIGYVGMLRRGIVPVMVNSTLDNTLLSSLLDSYQPEYIWSPLTSEDESLYSYGDYGLLRTNNSRGLMNENLALLITTSGSTGSPKLVMQTYRNIDSNTKAIADYLGITAEDRAITTLPLSYTYGLSILNTHLEKGATIILTERTFMEKEFWRILKEEEVTTFGGVPYTYEMLDKLRFLRMKLPSVKYITQAGGKLGKELHAKFAQGMTEQDKAFIVMYGATEATARMSYVPKEYSIDKAGSIGIPIPGGRFELIDEGGNTIEDADKVGELIYYGDNVTMGYALCKEDLNKEDERHGRLETGDMAYRDSDGYYFVVGRKKRFLKVYGNRVNLSELEDILAKAGYVCACTGEDDRVRIYTTNKAVDEILDKVAELTHINRAAFSVIHIDELPRNDSGKIMYSELK